jgi:hypothetical protein
VGRWSSSNLGWSPPNGSRVVTYPEPKDTAVKKLNDQIAATERRMDALHMAATAAGTAVEATITDTTTEWVELLGAAELDARTRYAEAVDEIERARAEIDRVRSVRSWVHSHDEHQKRFKGVWSTPMPIEGPSGDNYTPAQILAALRTDIDPPTIRRARLGGPRQDESAIPA